MYVVNGNNLLDLRSYFVRLLLFNKEAYSMIFYRNTNERMRCNKLNNVAIRRTMIHLPYASLCEL